MDILVHFVKTILAMVLPHKTHQFVVVNQFINLKGQGTCISIDTCTCINNLFVQPVCQPVGQINICDGITSQNNTVCGGNGACIGFNHCICKAGYSGNYCENFYCFSIESTNNSVCSGNGNCKSIDKCICNVNYNGTRCENRITIDILNKGKFKN
jgi:hypothetical protein